MEIGDDYTCLMVEGRPVAGAFPPQMEGIPPHWDVYFNVDDCNATTARAVELGAQGARCAIRPAGDRTDRRCWRDPQGALVAFLQNPPEDGS